MRLNERDLFLHCIKQKMKGRHVRFLFLTVAPILPLTSAVSNEHQHYCGKTWPDAFDNCYLPCPTQTDSECASLGMGIDDGEWKCFGYTGCNDKLGLVDEDEETTEMEEEQEEGESSITVIQKDDSYCGLSWGDAAVRCDTPCGSGSECTRGETCYSATNCAVPLIVVKSQLMVSMVGPDQTMDYTDQGIFKETLNDFIAGSAVGEGVGLKDVGLGQQSLSLRRLTANVTNIRHRQLPLGSSALDVSVTVTGEYRPPPYVDFDMICEDSINRDPDMVVGSLQDRGGERGRPFFERVQGIEALRAGDLTKRPTRAPTDRPTTLKPTAVSGDASLMFLYHMTSLNDGHFLIITPLCRVQPEYLLPQHPAIFRVKHLVVYRVTSPVVGC